MPVVSVNDSGQVSVPILPSYGPATTVAAAGSAIGNATAITARVNLVTGADDTKGVILPSTANPGDEYLIYQTHATQGLKVYPHVNGDINDGSANAAIVQEGKTLGRYIMLDGTTWMAQFTANA